SKKLFFELIDIESVKTKSLIASYDKTERNDSSPFFLPVSIFLDPIENGPVEKYPHTLGELQDLLLKRGSDIVIPLKSALNEVMTEQGLSIKRSEKEFVLLLLGIPRSRNGEIEKVDVCGFIINSGFCQLGEALSVYFRDQNQNRWFRWTNIGGDREGEDQPWRLLGIEIAETKCYPSPSQIRQLSGLDRDGEGPNGIIAGVGALGGSIAQIWSKECWGKWTYVDTDIVQPHNVVRHISTRHGIGLPKSYVVGSLTRSIHLHEAEKADRHFNSSILSEDPKLLASIRDSELLVDISTTLHVPRELSRRNDVPRTVSAFITPSGKASVMLMEDGARSLRCSTLEAQYYRAILESDWGVCHLAGHTDRLWVGAGCRQVTFILSNELIQLHAATLARQIRNGLSEEHARISIWDYQDESGGIIPHTVEVFPSHSQILGEWEACWDDGFLKSAIDLRASSLPNETGGIVFGVIDQKERTITLVKACSAPTDSESTHTGFTRAAYESTGVLDECHRRTSDVVTYVGEWHSHPQGYGALPSTDDLLQLVFLSEALQTEGMPALMMIVADNSVGFYLDSQGIIVKL
ncbi:MAG: Mov34/MPN/PAD-1 family protein, partial [Halioglobus sp.]|nr:Mov34/MPN/PAD-1 family protein [Halioglobus sp.]